MFRLCSSLERVLQPGKPYPIEFLVVPQNGSVRVTVRSTSPQRGLWWALRRKPDRGSAFTILEGWVDPMGYHSEVKSRLDAGIYALDLACSPNTLCSGVGRIENLYP